MPILPDVIIYEGTVYYVDWQVIPGTAYLFMFLPRLSLGLHSVLKDKKLVWRPYAVTTAQSSGLKSRPGNYPCAPVVKGSGVLATGGRKFPIGKAAGRSASEPTCSLVKLFEDPDPVDRWGRAVHPGFDNGSSPVDLPG